MFKAMIMLTRKSDLGADEFVDWWTGHHSRLASAPPGIRRIVLNVSTGDGY